MENKLNLNAAFLAAVLAFAVVLAGCASQDSTANNPADIKLPVASKMNKSSENIEPVAPGPSGCSSESECVDYCSKNQLDCKAWCDVNKEACDKRGIKIAMPSGVPGSPCAADTDCMTGLCLNFRCELPNPTNLEKKPGFKLPGSCSSMSECGRYCAKPTNSRECLEFCSSFPSFCSQGAKEGRASAAPPECQSCLNCKAKDCILGCTYKCYAYMPFEKQDADSLRQGVVFERNYKEPIKAVWEPGPAYNRIGVEYFSDDYKAMGINTYHIIPKYTHNNEKKLMLTADYAFGTDADNEVIANLIRAKKAGFQVVMVAHDLYDLFPDANSNKSEKISYADYAGQVEETALKWAEAAEIYKAEYFVPVNEFEYVLYENGYTAEQACDATNELYRRVIPKVREIYKGKIYCRVGGMDAKFSCMDFSQCDIFGFTYGYSNDNYKSNFDSEFMVGEEVSKRTEKPYIMAESFSFNTKGWEACAELHRAGIESYKTNAENGKGYAFMGLIQNDPINKNSCPLIGTDLVRDYKNFFMWMDEK